MKKFKVTFDGGKHYRTFDELKKAQAFKEKNNGMLYQNINGAFVEYTEPQAQAQEPKEPQELKKILHNVNNKKYKTVIKTKALKNNKDLNKELNTIYIFNDTYYMYYQIKTVNQLTFNQLIKALNNEHLTTWAQELPQAIKNNSFFSDVNKKQYLYNVSAQGIYNIHCLIISLDYLPLKPQEPKKILELKKAPAPSINISDDKTIIKTTAGINITYGVKHTIEPQELQSKRFNDLKTLNKDLLKNINKLAYINHSKYILNVMLTDISDTAGALKKFVNACNNPLIKDFIKSNMLEKKPLKIKNKAIKNRFTNVIKKFKIGVHEFNNGVLKIEKIKKTSLIKISLQAFKEGAVTDITYHAIITDTTAGTEKTLVINGYSIKDVCEKIPQEYKDNKYHISVYPAPINTYNMLKGAVHVAKKSIDTTIRRNNGTALLLTVQSELSYINAVINQPIVNNDIEFLISAINDNITADTKDVIDIANSGIYEYYKTTAGAGTKEIYLNGYRTLDKYITSRKKANINEVSKEYIMDNEGTLIMFDRFIAKIINNAKKEYIPLNIDDTEKKAIYEVLLHTIPTLKAQQIRIIKLLAIEKTQREIAEKLKKSVSTINEHIKTIRVKLLNNIKYYHPELLKQIDVDGVKDDKLKRQKDRHVNRKKTA